MVVYRFGDFVLDVDAFALKRDGVTLPLQPKVLDVLRYLIEQRGRVVPKAELLERLWHGEDVNEAVLSWSVSHIRRALGQRREDKHPIQTVHGRGYSFSDEVGAVATAPRAAPATDARGGSFVGRERAMAELRQSLRDAAAGHGKLCVITGEAGIGKTRCADELARSAAALSVQVLAGRCPQAPGTPPLWPIESAARQLGPEAAARIRPCIAALREHDDARAPARNAAARFDALETLARWLRELATSRPALLILDDLHWADAATLQLLGFIAPELSELPLCIVATLRDRERELGQAPDPALMRVLRHARTIPLGSLSSEHIADLIATLGGQRPSAALAEAVRRASGGIPLFVQEVARALIGEHGDGAIERLRPDAVRVPALARDVLRQRIAQLPAPSIDVLSHAAVIGDSFDLSLLAGAAELEPEVLLDRLAPAIAERLIDGEAPHVYGFAHALFQSVLYDDLSPRRRAAIHRKLMALLEQRHDRAARLGEIARHAYFSLPVGDAERVVRATREAGEAAARATAFDDAVLYFGWALEAQRTEGAEPRARTELLLSLASAQRSAGRTGDATDTAARAIELAQQHHLHDLVVVATRTRRPTVALATLPDALARSALELVLREIPIGPEPACIRALAQLACVPPYDRDLARSKELSAHAVQLAQQQADREVLFEAMRARLFALSGPDDVDEVLLLADRMLELESQGPRSWQGIDARMARVSAFVLAGRIAEADAALAQTETAVGGAHWGEAAFYCQRMRAQRRFLDGHFDEAERMWMAAYRQAARAGVAYAEVLRDAQIQNLELEREGAKSAFDKYLRAAGSLRAQPRPLRSGSLRIAALAGELEFVRAELGAFGDPAEYPRDGAYLNTLANLAVCATAIDDKARCEQLLSLLWPYSARNTPDATGYYLGSVAYFLGLLSVALGKHVQARGCLERALAHNRAMGYRAGAVRTRLALAELEHLLGHGSVARASLQAAREEARALGMDWAATEAGAALAPTARR